MEKTGKSYTVMGFKIDQYTHAPTIESRLYAAGLCHRRDQKTDADGKHEIYREDTGQVIGRYDALAALSLIR